MANLPCSLSLNHQSTVGQNCNGPETSTGKESRDQTIPTLQNSFKGGACYNNLEGRERVGGAQENRRRVGWLCDFLPTAVPVEQGDLGFIHISLSFSLCLQSMENYIYNSIYFIFGCAGSLLLPGLFSKCGEPGLLSSCSA